MELDDIPCLSARWSASHAKHIMHYIIVALCKKYILVSYILVGVAFKWLVSETPYLVHEAAKAPHVTGCGVYFFRCKACSNQTVLGTAIGSVSAIVHTVNCSLYLWGSPLDRDLASMRHIVGALIQVTRHPKVTDLQYK